MSHQAINLTGQTFGRLTVLTRGPKARHATWNCRCSCGNLTLTEGIDLRRGKSKSCGCLKNELSAARCKASHNPTQTPA